VQRAGQDGRARPEAGAADISSRAAAAFPVAPPQPWSIRPLRGVPPITAATPPVPFRRGPAAGSAAAL